METKIEDFTKHASISIQITSVDYIRDEIAKNLIEILLKNNNNVTFIYIYIYIYIYDKKRMHINTTHKLKIPYMSILVILLPKALIKAT